MYVFSVFCCTCAGTGPASYACQREGHLAETRPPLSKQQDVERELNAALAERAARAAAAAAAGNDDGNSASSSQPPPRVERVPGAPMALLLPGSGPHAVDYASCGGRELLISRRAAEAVLRGAEVFVPGVIAVTAGCEAGDLVAVTAAIETCGAGGGAARPARFGVTRGTVLPAAAARGGGGGKNGGGGGGGGGAEGEEGGGRQEAAAAPASEGGGGGGGGGRLHIGVARLQLGRAELFRAARGVAAEMVARVYDVAAVPGARICVCVCVCLLLFRALSRRVASWTKAGVGGSRMLRLGRLAAFAVRCAVPLHSALTRRATQLHHYHQQQSASAAASCCKTCRASPRRSRCRRRQGAASSTCAPPPAARARCSRS